ncbi:hypothetical protein AV654_19325 [Paenibacillus elgii]|uniref:MPN domain-containing protein n=1 Tax=Paenibacillus elgii TaxID=189691 RepID=A0A163XMJ6_9BACL|nr:DNA repair protein RadC [Paenibacillus elgii]KZE78128.1 hypothetical protein AV654_19325 [Paenibacillus elgii]
MNAPHSVDVLIVKQERIGTLQVANPVITSPNIAFEIVKSYLGEPDREHFVILCLSTKNRVNGIHTVSIGSASSALVHPREVFKLAILNNASGIILAHNHPSGVTTPSEEDISTTKRLVEAGQLIGIEVLDHLIICEFEYCSLRENGLM